MSNNKMSPKIFIYGGMILGSYIGGALPLLWGASSLSFSSIIFGTIGGVTGIWAGFKLSKLF